jgi:hypothetical protein
MQPSRKNNTTHWTLVVIAFVFAGFLTSCSDDDEAVDPQARVAFLGSYQMKDQNSEESQYFSFTLQVKESTKGADKIDLKNFRYINNGLYATVKGNQLFISQVMQDSDEKVEISGQGTLTGDKLIYNYKVVVNKTGQNTRVFENTAEGTRIQ